MVPVEVLWSLPPQVLVTRAIDAVSDGGRGGTGSIGRGEKFVVHSVRGFCLVRACQACVDAFVRCSLDGAVVSGTAGRDRGRLRAGSAKSAGRRVDRRRERLRG
ncbi:unnamed protein product, partial [Scytosiphon promiscuus]